MLDMSYILDFLPFVLFFLTLVRLIVFIEVKSTASFFIESLLDLSEYLSLSLTIQTEIELRLSHLLETNLSSVRLDLLLTLAGQ